MVCEVQIVDPLNSHHLPSLHMFTMSAFSTFHACDNCGTLSPRRAMVSGRGPMNLMPAASPELSGSQADRNDVGTTSATFSATSKMRECCHLGTIQTNYKNRQQNKRTTLEWVHLAGRCKVGTFRQKAVAGVDSFCPLLLVAPGQGVLVPVTRWTFYERLLNASNI